MVQMTVFRLWSAVNQLTTKPQPSATSDWWNLCDDCNRLDGPHATEDAAEAVTHHCKPRKRREKAAVERRPYRAWTDDDDTVVLTHTRAEAARILGRSRRAIHSRIQRLRSTGAAQPSTRTHHQWTPEQDAILIAHEIRDAMRLTGASKSAVEWRRKQLADQGVIERRPPRISWTDEEDQIIATHSISDATRLLPIRSALSIRNRRWKLTRQGVTLAIVGVPGPKTKAA